MTTPEPLRILIATTSLSSRSGTDLYTRDLALALLRRGCLPIVYTSRLGRIGEELRRATIPVVDNLDAVAARPDVIHGHHALETLAALARFRNVPALFVCHDSFSWHSIPPRSSRIRSWVAVDRNCRDRMMFEHGVAEESIHVLANAVDLAGFRRRDPLPAIPQRALVFNNSAAETFVSVVRSACDRRGIALDVVGEVSGQASWSPETVLPQYDLVFARARCALEAAAVGCAVVVCDPRGMAGMLTTASLAAMRVLNLGARTLQLSVTAENVGKEIDRYDAEDAAAVSDQMRASSDIDVLAEQYMSIYRVLAGQNVAVDPEQELRDVGSALSVIAQHIPRSKAVSGARLRLLNMRVLARPIRAIRWLKQRLDL